MVTRILSFAGRHGRACLVLGLLAGLSLPDLAAWLRPSLPVWVGLLLFLTALRVGAAEAVGGLKQSRQAFAQILVLQLALPVICLGIFMLLRVEIAGFALAVILMLAAPSVTGAPNFAIMNGQDPAPAMRILVLGTAAFPILVLPVFLLLPQLGGLAGLTASLRLVGVILLAVGGGFAVRALLGASFGPEQRHALDGLTAVALAIIVVGLMSALGPLLQSDPARLLVWVSAVFAVNFGLQISVFYLYRGAGRSAVSMTSGNRNVALFLVALPDHVVAPLLIFIGCYQIPMYLTPLLLKRLHSGG